MELPKEYAKAIGAVLTRLKRPSLAKALSSATLIYGMSRNGNAMDSESKDKGRSEDVTAQKRVWIETAILPTEPGKPEATKTHIGVNPVNARNKKDVCISLIHASIIAEVAPAIEANTAGQLRVYKKEFTEAAAGILQHWPTNEPKPSDGRVKGREAFYASKELSALLDEIVPSLPPLPFSYKAEGRANEPVNLLVNVKREIAGRDPKDGILYRAPATWPDRGKDDGEKQANRTKALEQYDAIRAEGMFVYGKSVDTSAPEKDQAKQREAMTNDVTTQWLLSMAPHLHQREVGEPEAKPESERKVG
jgi:hypothetical protein